MAFNLCVTFANSQMLGEALRFRFVRGFHIRKLSRWCKVCLLLALIFVSGEYSQYFCDFPHTLNIIFVFTKLLSSSQYFGVFQNLLRRSRQYREAECRPESHFARWLNGRSRPELLESLRGGQSPVIWQVDPKYSLQQKDRSSRTVLADAKTRDGYATAQPRSAQSVPR